MFSRFAGIVILLLHLSSTATAADMKPRRFYVEPSNFKNIALSAPQFLFRLGSGAFVEGWSPSIVDESEDTVKDDYSIVRFLDFKIKETSAIREWKKPKQPLELYEFEGCPFCRKVREAVSILDLDVVFYPCPRGGPTYRVKVLTTGGKQQFPYLVDPNTNKSMYESDEIINYLFTTYGNGVVPPLLTGGFWTTLTCSLAMIFRLGKGSAFQEAKPAKQPLVFWGYEASPFCKVVREKLNELEIPHLQKSCARGSAKRNELLKKTGYFQVNPTVEMELCVVH